MHMEGAHRWMTEDQEVEESEGRTKDQMVISEEGRLPGGVQGELRQSLGGSDELLDGWATTGEVLKDLAVE